LKPKKPGGFFEMGKYGKQIRIQTKIMIRENGNMRTLFSTFPKKPNSFDRPENSLAKWLFWFLSVFEKHVTPLRLITIACKYDSREKENIMEYIRQGNEERVKNEQ
jgi:hypothetical protein